MKHVLTKLAGAAGALGAAAILGGLLSSPAAGVRVTDAQAAALTGGCQGATSYSCGAGTCPNRTVYGVDTTKANENYNATGSATCGGNGDWCNSYYGSQKVCTS